MAQFSMALFVQIIIPVAGAFGEISRIAGSIGLIFGRDVFLRENSFRGADRDACAAVNAGVGVNKEEIAPGSIAFGAGDDAVYRANFNAVALASAKCSDYVGH
jgi:hypothetical protein